MKKKANTQKYYQCPECGFFYKEKELAEKCKAWCKEHKSCNLEIIAHAVMPPNIEEGKNDKNL